MIRKILVAALALFANASFAQPLDRFEKDVEGLRSRLKMPGLSAIIVKDQKVLWTKGFGFADLENRVPATPDTLYHLASVTKTFASTLIMQLVEQGKLDLDEPISHYSGDFKDDSVRIKHLITHTSSGTPGDKFQYDGNRYDYLTAVIEKKFGKPFPEVVVETFFDPLGMSQSVPYHNVVVDSDKWVGSIGRDHIERYAANLKRFAKPYAYYGAGEILDDTYPSPESIGAAAGLLSTVRDMAKYDIAIDRHRFIRKETQEKAWTPFVSNSGGKLPYGLGWFVSDWHGTKLVWHYGQWGSGFSAIYLKIPRKNVSIVMLANSEVLADVGYEDLSANVFVCGFLGLWGLAYDCEARSQAAMAKWIEERKAKAIVPIHMDAADLEPYVGEYQFPALDNRIFAVTREGERLFVQGTKGRRVEVFPQTPTRFFLKLRAWQLVFSRPEGQPAQLEIVEGADTYKSTRIR